MFNSFRDVSAYFCKLSMSQVVNSKVRAPHAGTAGSSMDHELQNQAIFQDNLKLVVIPNSIIALLCVIKRFCVLVGWGRESVCARQWDRVIRTRSRGLLAMKSGKRGNTSTCRVSSSNCLEGFFDRFLSWIFSRETPQSEKIYIKNTFSDPNTSLRFWMLWYQK